MNIDSVDNGEKPKKIKKTKQKKDDKKPDKLDMPKLEIKAEVAKKDKSKSKPKKEITKEAIKEAPKKELTKDEKPKKKSKPKVSSEAKKEAQKKIESQQLDFAVKHEQQNKPVNHSKFRLDLKPVQNQYKDTRLEYSLFKHDNNIPKDLPVFQILKEIGESVKHNQITIVKAATGSGKSLGIPPYFVNNGLIVRVSLPTIPATLGLYKFVRENAHNKDDVGYSCYGDVFYDRMRTKLAFCTTKHLINDMKLVLNNTRSLPNNFMLMIDEAHHTSTENKAILKLALYMIKKQFNIKLVIASATLGDMNFSNFKSKTIQSSGRLYPISIHWSDKDIDPADMRKAVIYTVNKIVDVVTESTAKEDFGGILVFVPGEAEVETIALQLESMKSLNLAVFRLYSNMPSEEIMDAFVRVPEGITKVVISTNIGESSITIPDVCKVIDMGLQKTPYDNRIGMRLVTDFAPKDKLTQRKGRAGRTSNGDYYPMFTEKQWDEFKDTDLSDMDRMLPYMIVLEFLDAGLDAQEILEIDDARYKPLVEKLTKLGLLDSNNKITDIGHSVPNYPFSLENAIVAYKSLDLIYKSANSDVKIDRNDPAVVATLIIVAMIEGSQGNSFFWIPKEHRKTSAMKQTYMNEKYKNFKGDTDFVTFINIFAGMMHEASGHTSYAYVKWAQDNSMNNKLLSNVRKNFKRLIEMTYGISQNDVDGTAEKQIFDMLKSFYGIKNLTQLGEPSVMTTVYELFEDVYSDCKFDEPVEIGKKKLLHYHSNDGTKYRIDGFRSFSRMESMKMHRLVALQVIETKNGQQTSRYISCLFPSKDQAVREIADEWETCSTDSNFSMGDIDFAMLGDLGDLENFADTDVFF